MQDRLMRYLDLKDSTIYRWRERRGPVWCWHGLSATIFTGRWCNT